MKQIRLGLVFKDFASWLLDTSSVGLNVAGYTTAQVLREHGVNVTVFPVRHNVDLVNAINRYNEANEHPLTHLVISAPWLSPFDLEILIQHFKDIQFVILSHSNVGFLQADACGVELLRAYQDLEDRYLNLRVGGNSRQFVKWLEAAYHKRAILLPNLYSTKDAQLTKQWDSVSSLKVGAFGAVRPYKNFMTAAAAALVIHSITGVPVEFHMSAGGEGDGDRVSVAIEAMLKDTGVTLVKHGWSYWYDFIKLVASMDLMIQVSYTESFNLITADGVLAGVPSVVSSAIRWAPSSWKADVDDAIDVARKGVLLLKMPPSNKGIKALTSSNENGIVKWFEFLNIKENHDG